MSPSHLSCLPVHQSSSKNGISSHKLIEWWYSSPLFHYTPCKECNPFSFTTTDNSTHIATSITSDATISLNFTGTAIIFDLDLSTGLSSLIATLHINGSVPSSSNPTGTSAADLPYGLHQAELKLSASANRGTESGIDGSEDEVRMFGAAVSMGVLVGAATENITVDDTAWRSGQVMLSPGWNMLESGASNWINTVGRKDLLLRSFLSVVPLGLSVCVTVRLWRQNVTDDNRV